MLEKIQTDKQNTKEAPTFTQKPASDTQIDLSAKDVYDFFSAIRNKKTEKVNHYLQEKPNLIDASFPIEGVDFDQRGFTPLHQAAITGDPEIIERLCKYSSLKINAILKASQLTALHLVILFGKLNDENTLKCIQILIKNNANYNMKTQANHTALNFFDEKYKTNKGKIQEGDKIVEQIESYLKTGKKVLS